MNSKELLTSGLGIAGLTLGFCMWPAAAAPGRTTEVDVSQPDSPVRVVRQRAPGRQEAVFDAQAAAVEPGAYVRFDIHAEGERGATPRWSCVATNDVSDCFASPVTVRYLPGDARMVLTVTAGYVEGLAVPEPDADPAMAAL